MVEQRRVLGRGLAALIPLSGTAAFSRDYVQCPLDDIVAADGQPRSRFDERSLAQLAASIRDKGVLQPVVVARHDGGFRLIAGERRVRAARLAGLSTIPALIRDVASVEAYELALIENIQREDLDPLEEAVAYRRLMDARGYSQEQLASRVGKDRSTVANSLRLLGLADEMRRSVADGTISAGHGRALLMVTDDGARRELFGEVVSRRLSVRQAETRARALKSSTATRKRNKHVLAPLHRSVADDLSKQFGAKVRVVPRSGRRGRVVIEFESLEMLKRIHDLCMGR